MLVQIASHSLSLHNHPNVAVAVLANRTTCMAWAMLENAADSQPDAVAR